MENLTVKGKSMGIQRIHPLTTHEISHYLQVDLSTVINWCDQGKLAAYKTPGGHRRVVPESLMQFVEKYELPMPEDLKQRISGVLKILIVDDEPDVRRMIHKMLKKKIPNAQIVEAGDGFEAGKMVLDVLPHLVILDLKLPGIDGFKVCSDIKSDERLKETKIIAITGQNTVQNKKLILDAGADGYLPKPFEVGELTKMVSSLLNLPEEQNNENS